MTANAFPDRLWYAAMPETEIPRGTRVSRQYLGNTFLIGRNGNGHVVVVDRERGETCFHRIGHGLLWLYAGNDPPGEGPPCLTDIDGEAPKVAESVVLPCDFDNAVYGLLDPAHGPYVHASRWWRPRHGLREKRKRIVPSRHGFTMARHAPTQGALGYRLLGTNVSTEISFELPGLGTETIEGSRVRVVSVTTMTPLTQRRIQMLHLLYWDTAWLETRCARSPDASSASSSARTST